MEWFEPLIIIGAIMIVVLPFILAFRRHKKGIRRCDGNCSGCIGCKSIEELYKQYKNKEK